MRKNSGDSTSSYLGFGLYVRVETVFIGIARWHGRHKGYSTIEFLASVITIGGFLWAILPSDPATPGSNPDTSTLTIPTATPTDTAQNGAPPESTPTVQLTPSPFPSPRYQVFVAGVGGGPNAPFESVFALLVDNLGDQSFTAFAAVEDIDPYHNVTYVQQRQDIPAGDRRSITFLNWTPGACYVARLLIARTEKGLADLVSASATREGIPLSSLTATGDVEIAYTSDKACSFDTPQPNES